MFLTLPARADSGSRVARRYVVPSAVSATTRASWLSAFGTATALLVTGNCTLTPRCNGTLGPDCANIAPGRPANVSDTREARNLRFILQLLSTEQQLRSRVRH